MTNFFYLINIKVLFILHNPNLDFDDYVNIYSTEQEERIAHLGSVFHNKKSRNMWILLSNNPDKEYYLKEMAVILEGEKNPRLPIYEHHIKSMVKSGIVSTTEKMHNKHKTTFYRAAPITVIISAKHYENAKNSALRNSLTQLYHVG